MQSLVFVLSLRPMSGGTQRSVHHSDSTFSASNPSFLPLTSLISSLLATPLAVAWKMVMLPSNTTAHLPISTRHPQTGMAYAEPLGMGQITSSLSIGNPTNTWEQVPLKSIGLTSEKPCIGFQPESFLCQIILLQFCLAISGRLSTHVPKS